jgi:hypothetical protein
MKEVLKLALEALELLTDTEQTFGALDYGDNAITALKEALAQPEQEPVEWLTGCPECGMDSGCACDSGTWNPPAAQRPWVDLTDEDEIDWDGGDLKSLIKAIEAKLKEKNT